MAGPCMTTRSMNLVYSNEKLSSGISQLLDRLFRGEGSER